MNRDAARKGRAFLALLVTLTIYFVPSAPKVALAQQGFKPSPNPCTPAGAGWRKLTCPSPPSRFGGGMAYDPVFKQIVMFGGCRAVSRTVVTVKYVDKVAQPNVTVEKEIGMDYSSYPPQVSSTEAFEWCNPYSVLNDTWVWSGVTGQWTNVTPANTPLEGSATWPSARYLTNMIYDENSRRILLFGGLLQTNNANHPAPADASLCFAYNIIEVKDFSGIHRYFCFKDLWEWNGSGWTKAVTNAGPSGRFDASMSADAQGRPSLLVGGCTGMGLAHGHADYVNNPQYRYKYWDCLKYARSNAGSEYGVNGERTETWTLTSLGNGQYQWDQKCARLDGCAMLVPPGSRLPDWCYQPGGLTPDYLEEAKCGYEPPCEGVSGGPPINPECASPGEVRGATMAYDPGTDRIVLYGGYYYTPYQDYAGYARDTWEWRGSDQKWIHRLNKASKDGSCQPVPRSMAWASATAAPVDGTWQIVIFGGHGRNPGAIACRPDGKETANISEDETWTWSGIYSSCHDLSAVPGGTVRYHDTNCFDVRMDPPPELDATGFPGERDAAMMVYDPISRTVVLFGGKCTPTAGRYRQNPPLGYDCPSNYKYYAETWAWDPL